MNYALESRQVIAKHYGTDSPMVTYKPAIEVPNDEEIERLKSTNILGETRKLVLMVSNHGKDDPNGWMHQYGLWPENKNMVREITIETTSTLSLKDYTKLMAAAFSEDNMKVHNIIEEGSDE